jgi:hypothetical protein
MTNEEFWTRVQNACVVDSCGGLQDDKGYFTLSGSDIGMDAEEEVQPGTRRFFRRVYWLDDPERFEMVPVIFPELAN